MTQSYIEKEIKVIDIFVDTVVANLEKLGAKKVFDDDRVFIYFDYDDRRLSKEENQVRLTEEEKLKLSWSSGAGEQKETIKVFVSRKKETVDFLGRLGLRPIAAIPSHRISFELEGIDFDIDQFPQIPAFIEIDMGSSAKSQQEILDALGIGVKEVLHVGTLDIYRKFGIDPFEAFKV